MNKDTFVTHLGVEVQTLELWLEQEWIVPERNADDLAFSDIDVARARLIQELTGGFGVNNEGIDVILHLLDQLHGMRRALAALNAEMR